MKKKIVKEKDESFLKFKTTKEIEVKEEIISQVVGQDEALEVIKKSALQRRHVLLLGEPGTGKSLLGKALAEILSVKKAVDMLSYQNPKDENNPIIKITKAGDGTKIVDKVKTLNLKNVNKGQGGILIIVFLIGIAISYYHYWRWKTGIIPDTVYAAWIIADVIIICLLIFTIGISASISKKMGGFGQMNESPPKLIIDNSNKKIIFEDASGAHEGALLGDILHDPFQSGGLGTPAHQRVIAGMIHKANGGVLFIDEIANLKPEMQQELLTAIQDKQMSISGRSKNSGGAMVRTTPCPTDFILVAAGNLDTLKHMHPALRSRIRGNGYEIYMNETMKDTPENQKKIVQFIAQEIKTDGKIPAFTKKACLLIIEEAKRRAEKGKRLTTRFRELGGIIRVAGDIAKQENKDFTDETHIIKAQKKVKSIEQQLIGKSIENQKDYEIIKIVGSSVGKINALAVIGDTPPRSGKVMSIQAEVVLGETKQKVNATGKLGEIAKESIINISAIILKNFGEDITKNHSIYVQFIQTYGGVEGDSASIAIGSIIVSALKGIPVKQDIGITGSLSVKGEVLPIGGVSAKIEGAYNVGIRKVIIPKTNLQDITLASEIEKVMKIIPVENFGEVLLEILDFKIKDKKIKDRIKRNFKV